MMLSIYGVVGQQWVHECRGTAVLHILKVWRHIKNPTLSIDASLPEEQDPV